MAFTPFRPRLTRRGLFRTAGAGAGLLLLGPLGGCADIGRPVPEPLFCTTEQMRLLEALVDALLPAADGHAGALAAGAASYIDALLGAFTVDPPLVFAGGPFSGRHGGAASFAEFLPLTRIEEIRWRTTIEGSQGIPDREMGGPVRGWQEVYCEGLSALEAAALEVEGVHFWEVPVGDREPLLDAAAPAFVDLVWEHTLDGTYADPVYGGNGGGLGWAAVDFPGDSQPAGYDAAFLLEVYLRAKGG